MFWIYIWVIFKSLVLPLFIYITVWVYPVEHFCWRLLSWRIWHYSCTNHITDHVCSDVKLITWPFGLLEAWTPSFSMCCFGKYLRRAILQGILIEATCWGSYGVIIEALRQEGVDSDAPNVDARTRPYLNSWWWNMILCLNV